MVTGIVSWFDNGQGLGVIRPQYGGKDVFVHASALRDCGLNSLREGQRVRFVVADGARGSSAVKIELV
ncbi:MAG: cold-shock protein [Gammaproteobacteria bacterium SG8_47]|nr:MAG: cold-shock protein [Gammaproteobacteria bacterium SG8_47]